MMFFWLNVEKFCAREILSRYNEIVKYIAYNKNVINM